MKQILSLAILLALGGLSSAAGNPLPNTGAPVSRGLTKPVQEQCGWYVIFLCSRDADDAADAAARESGAQVLDSSSPDFYSFRQGWYCAAYGPSARSPALKQLSAVRRRYPTAYAKQAC
jgi:hypothetical protein